eukprot:1693540-Pyramimonas_sp.AAC.1
MIRDMQLANGLVAVADLNRIAAYCLFHPAVVDSVQHEPHGAFRGDTLQEARGVHQLVANEMALQEPGGVLRGGGSVASSRVESVSEGERACQPIRRAAAGACPT